MLVYEHSHLVLKEKCCDILYFLSFLAQKGRKKQKGFERCVGFAITRIAV